MAASEFADGVALSNTSFWPHDELLGVVAVREESALLVVVEQADQVVGDRPGEVEP